LDNKVQLGRHVLAEFYGVRYSFLNSPGFIKRSVIDAIKVAGMHLRKLEYEHFTPQGITMLAILSESHIAVHTWPEKGCAAIECFTCGEEGDPWKALQYLKSRFEPVETNERCLVR
jgi:S-adenosylmethionine decarboxylase